MFIGASLYTIPVKAQEKDSTVLAAAKPIFSGNEKNLTDTLMAYGNAATSPEFKAVVDEAVTVIKNPPTDGKVDSWYAWIIAALGALFGVYQFFKSKKTPEPDPASKPADRYR